jgi:hypothetical protein
MATSLDMHGMADQLKMLVGFAVDIGFTAHSHKGGVRLIAPGSSKTIEVPRVRQYRASNLESLTKQVFRYGDPEKRSATMRALTLGTLDIDPDIKFAVLAEDAQNTARVMVDMPVEQTARTLVRRGPWLARKSVSGKGPVGFYESHAVIEEEWSDGTTVYLCSKCDYRSDRPRGVSSHYANRHATHVTKPGPVVTVVDEKESPRLVRLLAHALEEREKDDSVDNTYQGQAAFVLAWMRDRPGWTDYVKPADDLTLDEALGRIRDLVKQEVESATKTAHSERDEALLNVAKAREEMEEVRRLAHAEREEMRTNLATLGDLIQSLRGESGQHGDSTPGEQPAEG